MSWKENLKSLENNEIESYLESLGFYKSTMNPRFMSGKYDNIISLSNKCLRLDTDYKKDKTCILRIFVNDKEVYVEVQNGFGSLEFNAHAKINNDITIEKLNELLNNMID